MELTIRPAADDDLSALVALLRACDLVDIGSEETTEDDVLWPWRKPGIDRERDTFVVESGGAPVGYGFVLEGESDAWVHPEHRGHGIGSALLSAIETRAAEQGSPDGMLRQNVTSLDHSGQELLKRHGYDESHHYARMELSLDEAPAIPPVPDGYEISNFEEGMEREVYETYAASWAQYAPEWRDEGFESWLTVTEEGDFERDLWFIVRRAGKPVAYGQNIAYPNIGWVQMVGTIPEERGSGLGQLLLSHALDAFYRRGLRRAGLTVSSRNLPAARRLYERNGFRETLRYINMAKPLPN